MIHNNYVFWIFFTITITVMFLIDLYATSHRHGKIGVKDSLKWSGVWIAAALLFNLFILFFADDGKAKSLEFLAGYLIEKSLSIDNLFVFLMIFNIMGVKDENQPHVLKWGIISAIVMRIIFILAGVTLMEYFHPIIYIFGAFLFYAAYKMSFGKEYKIDYEKNPIILFITRRFRFLHGYTENKFFVRDKNNKINLTPIFLTFILIESSDIVFAVDSIPAVIAITHDPFIVITSNIFAILGLRALYFALSGIVDLFIYLKYGVAVILAFVGVKMLITDFYHISTLFSLSFILFCLSASVIVSLIFKKK